MQAFCCAMLHVQVITHSRCEGECHHYAFCAASHNAPDDSISYTALSAMALGAGLDLLQRLLAWPHLLLPMAEAICALLGDLLRDASAASRLPACTRTHLYKAVHATLAAYALPAAEPLAPALLQAAWAEFAHAPAAAAPDLLSAVSKRSAAAAGLPAKGGAGKHGKNKRRRTGQGPGGGIPEASAECGLSASVEHSHRPANAQHVTACQVRMPQGMFVMLCAILLSATACAYR